MYKRQARIVADAVDLVADSLGRPHEAVDVEVVVVADPDLTDMASPAGVIRARADRWREGWELHVDEVGVTQSPDLESAPQQVADYVATVTGREVLVTDVEVLLRAGREH